MKNKSLEASFERMLQEYMYAYACIHVPLLSAVTARFEISHGFLKKTNYLCK